MTGYPNIDLFAARRLPLYVSPIPDIQALSVDGERGGSVVECQTPEREVRGSKPTAAVLCP